MADALTVFLLLYSLAATYHALLWLLEARMYRRSRDRWREAFWSIGPALGSPPEGVERIDV